MTRLSTDDVSGAATALVNARIMYESIYTDHSAAAS